ncbi:MAG: cellulose synthase subunit BcsC-related outer membrane protein [Candidatus Sulfotelmatobacter sp.]
MRDSIRRSRFIRLNWLFFLALSLPAGLVAQTAQPRQDGISILLGKARSLEARGRVDLASQTWRQILLVNPNQTEALAGLARVARENGNSEEERVYLDRLRKVDPRDPDIAATEKMHVVSPDERKRLDEAGRLSMQHKPDEAMKIYHDILGEEPPPGKWAEPFYETEAASTDGRARAIAQLRQICARNPNNEMTRLWLALVLTYDPKTRMEGFRLLESIQDPGAVEQARAPWRQALLWEKENPAAQAALDAYLHRYPDPELENSLASLRERQEHAQEDADKQHGFQALQSRDLATAEAKFQEVLRHSPNDANAIAGLGFVRLNQRRFSEAVALFERARSLAPQRTDVREGYDNAKFWLAMEQGATARQQNRPDAAIGAYQDALAIRPADAQALLGIAQAQVEKKNYPEAEAKFQQVLTQFPNDADALSGLGFIRLNQGKFDEAQTFLEKAHALSPNRTDVDQGYRNAKFWGVMKQGAAALDQNRNDAAVAAYRQALAENPSAKDALLGLAHASERTGNYPEAIRCYGQLTSADPADVQSWLGLMKSQMGLRMPQAVLEATQQIPPAARQQLEARSDYWSQIALAYYNTKQSSAGDQALQKALNRAAASDNPDALNARLEIAGALMNTGQTLRAIDIYRQASESHPDNSSAWNGLIGGYVRMHDWPRAKIAVRSMPQASYEAATKGGDFLNAVAAIYSAQGQCGEAEDFLNRSIAIDQAAGRQPAESTRLQLADIWMREGNYERAGEAYQQIVARDDHSTEAWRGYLTALHDVRDDKTAAAEAPRIPAPVFTQLQQDPSFLTLLASAQSTAGQKEQAIQLLEQARRVYRLQGQPTAIDLDVQLAWAMVDNSKHDPELRDLLTTTRARSDLTPKQRATMDEIWCNWSIRRASQALDSKEPAQAVAILTDAQRELPNDHRIPAALASVYRQQREWQKALNVYEAWKMTGADASDYRSAAGAALSAHNSMLADHYLRQGLLIFPEDPELLHMTAKQAVVQGNYQEGERYLKLALAASRKQEPNAQPSNSQPSDDALEREAASALRSDPASAVHPLSSSSSAPACQVTAGSTPGDLRVRPISQTSTDSSSGSVNIEELRNIQDEIDVVQNRNTPFVAPSDVVSGRTGDAGFGRLIVEDGSMTNVYTASNQVRFGIGGHGVYLFSGTPNGSSGDRFGSLAQGAVFGEQSALGYAGEAQLSTNTFGLMFGTTPQGFPVHNLTGGLRFRPRNGPVTFAAERDSVKDSLVSYAGARDPGTGIVWGGVVSNTGTAQLKWNPVSNGQYERIGMYISGGGGYLQGKNVPDNWEVLGNAGVYGQVVKGLTMGVNFSGMHYDKNLQFFSLGQGGYFSPQEYGVASIPISYFARHQRFEYRIRVSGGVQYISQDASPFYPTSAGAALPNQGLYASQVHTGPNYDADLRLGYRVSPHAYFEMFATANNARNYTYQAAGFSLKFLIRRLPTDTDLHPRSIPDWQGNPPFGIE